MNIGERVRVVSKITGPGKIFEGTIVQNDRWDPPNSFCLLTGNAEFPVSNFLWRNLLSIEKIAGGVKHKPLATRTRYVIVQGSKGHDHKLSLHSSGLVQCDCTGYGFRRHCSHHKLALNWLNKKYGKNWKEKVFV